MRDWRIASRGFSIVVKLVQGCFGKQCRCLGARVHPPLSYSLPFTASAVFPTLLGEIDAQMPSLGIVNYGLCVTTMEQVFILVSHGKAKDQQGIEAGQRGGEDPFSASADEQRDALAIDPNATDTTWWRHLRLALFEHSLSSRALSKSRTAVLLSRFSQYCVVLRVITHWGACD
jgi:hypothetical protein